MRARTITSAGVLLYINGKMYGRVFSFDFQSDTPRSPKFGLDVVSPVEEAPTTASVSGQIGVVRTVGDAGAEGAAMATSSNALHIEKYFSMQLVERGSQTTLFEADHCSVTQQHWSAHSKGLVSGTIGFTALEWGNELKTK